VTTPKATVRTISAAELESTGVDVADAEPSTTDRENEEPSPTFPPSAAARVLVNSPPVTTPVSPPTAPLRQDGTARARLLPHTTWKSRPLEDVSLASDDEIIAARFAPTSCTRKRREAIASGARCAVITTRP
jgi:hypothetical protein